MDSDAPSETVLSRFTRGLVRAFASSAPRLAEAAQMRRGELDLPMSEPAARQLWEVAPDVTGDPDVGLHFAEVAAIGDLGIAGYIGRASATVGDAITRIVELQRLMKDTSQLTLTPGEGGARLVDMPGPAQPMWPRALAEALLASWVLWPQRWAGPDCRAASVSFQHPAPPTVAEHARLFACPVEFDAPANAIVFAPDAWALPFTTADPQLARYLESAAVEEARRRRDGDPFLEQLEQAIVGAMPGGELAADRMARAVGLSRRSLHRRLNDRGLTYQTVVDELRHRTARSLLARGEHSVTEVAFLVGFSDPSGFRRAYRRWTGRAPTDG